jgi:hypothetical protein
MEHVSREVLVTAMKLEMRISEFTSDDVEMAMDLIMIVADGASFPEEHVRAPLYDRPFFPNGCYQVPRMPGCQ